MSQFIQNGRQSVNRLNNQRGFLALAGTFAILLLVPVTIYLNNQTQPQRTSNAQEKIIKQEMSQETLAALNLHPLASDEFAIVTRSNGKADGKKVTHTTKLRDGQTYSFESDQNDAFSIIEGDDKTINYIKTSEGVEIHKKDEIKSDGKQKIDSSVSKKLKTKNDVVPVIIQLAVPYDKFYESKQTKQKTSDKKAKFETVKNKVAGKFSSKSKIKKDLHIISGISADINEDTLSELAKSPDVKRVELDGEMRALLDTSLDQIRAKDVWGLVSASGQPLTGVGQRIAIIDTGVDYTHPDLGGCFGTLCKVIGGYDFINNDSNPMDDQGHGTHVAATAAGKGLLNGVAPDAKIIAVKVLNSGGSGTWSQVISGINYVTDPNGDGDTSDRVDVASMSLGGSGNPDDAVSLAVDNATATGIVFTIAAGNSGPSSSTIQSPGTARNAITVAASCKTSQIGANSYCAGPIASFSSRGPLVWNGVDLQKPDISAPGVLICAARWATSFSTSPTCFDPQHIRISGTSMATPHMAGVAALVREAYPDYTPTQVKQLLKTTTRNLGVSANDQGTGEVDAKAAIPISAKVLINPGNWTIISDPTKKQSITEQEVSVTPTDSAIASLSAQYDDTVPGVSVTLSKAVLQVANNTTDMLTATLAVDNDVAKPGNYMTRINLSENGVTKGTIPIFITVKSTLLASPAEGLDYGIDNPGLSSWTSDTKTITLTNLRTDTPQTVNTRSSSYITGITFQTPSSITVPASGSAAVDTRFVVNNTQVPNAIYSGTMTFYNAANTLNLSTKFVKFYVLVVQDTNASDLARTFPVTVHNRNGKVYYDYSSASPKTFYLNDPGTYDVIARYYYPPSKYADSTVVKEGISVTDGLTTVNISVAEAKNLVSIIPIDSSGQQGSAFDSLLKFSYFQLPMYNTSQGGITSLYMSNMSTNYNQEIVLAGTQPATKIHYYYYNFSGLDSNKTLTNVASDFKSMKVQWDIDQQTGSILPVVFVGNGSSSHARYWSNQSLSLPLTQTLYSFTPAAYKYYAQTYGATGQTIDDQPTFVIDGTLKRWTQFGAVLPDLKENIIYEGLGPSVWFGAFNNSMNAMNIKNYLTGFTYNLGGDSPAFQRQDYSTRPFKEIPFTLSKNGSVYYSGVLPNFRYSYTRLAAVSLTQAGLYTFQADFPYKNKGQDMLAKVRAAFDTSKADPNPPAIKRLYTYTNGARSEIYDPSGVNKIEAEFDPVGESMSSVAISFSADGLNFQPLTVDNNAAVYSTILPSTGTEKVTIQLLAKDTAGNELNYTFELPEGVSSAPPPTTTPAPTNTPIPTNTPAPTPTNTPIPTLQPTNTPKPLDPPPSVKITYPVNGAKIRRNSTINITASASDNIAIKRVEFFVNNSLKCSDTSTPYTCNYRLGSSIGTGYNIQAKAYDSIEQTATDTIQILSIK